MLPTELPDTAWDPSDIYGPLGPPGQRSREAIIEYVKKNSPLDQEGKRELCARIWQGELYYRQRHPQEEAASAV